MFYGKLSEQSFVLNKPLESHDPAGEARGPRGLLGDARQRPTPFSITCFPPAQLCPPPPNISNNAKVGLNGSLFSHKPLAELHIKVVLQSRNKFQAFSRRVIFLT